jgi:hypothetical protein
MNEITIAVVIFMSIYADLYNCIIIYEQIIDNFDRNVKEIEIHGHFVKKNMSRQKHTTKKVRSIRTASKQLSYSLNLYVRLYL